MKILTLEVAGFGPFRAEQFVDFTRFDDDGLFLIAGPTGAGKSSVLDAIMYALYGRAPRYDDGGTDKQIRSNFCGPTEPTRVAVEFEHGGERYRMSRSLDYQVPKKSGEGMRTVRGKLAFDRREGDQWHTLATRARDVAQEFAAVFPLSADEFLQVVLLAQNAFMKFLDAKTSERQDVLRKLFRTQLYRDLMEAVKVRADTARAAVGESRTSLANAVAEVERLRASVLAATESLDGAEPGQTGSESVEPEQTESESVEPEQLVAAALADIAAAELRVQRLRDRAAATAKADEKRAALALEQQQLQRTREQLRQQRDELQEQERTINERVLPQIAHAESAAPLLPYLEAEQQTNTAASAATSQLSSARAQLAGLATDPELELGGEQEQSVVAIASELERARELLGVLRDRAGAEDQLNQLQQAEQHASDRVAEAKQRLEQIQREAAERPAKLAEQRTRHTELTALAALREARAANVEQAQRIGDAAKQLPAAEEHCEQASAEYRSALAQREHADQHERELADRRYRNAAVELATQLHPDTPCPVCGAIEHPSPAHADGAEQAPVSETELAQAQEQSRAAHERVNDAQQLLHKRERTRDSLREQAAGTTPEDAAAALSRARAELKAAHDAGAQLDECAAQISQLERDIAGDAQEQRAAETELVTARGALTGATEATQQCRKEVVRLRGGQTSIGERIDLVCVLVTAAETLLEADTAATKAHQQLDAASAQLASRLADSPFADRDQLQAAALSASEVASLRDRVDRHRVAVAEVRAKLADERFEALSETPVDSDTPAAAARASAAKLTQLDQLAGSVATQHRQAQEQGEQANQLAARIGDEDARADTVARFADTLRGQNARQQNLEVFVLASWLEEIIHAANAHLTQLSSGRYQLEVDESLEAYGRQSGLGIAVFDSYNGELRQPKSLSGGETFLVSLALALGLAEVVSAQAGGISLDTLFIDEGFGSLDSETLEVAMRTLDQLRQGGRTVGVISHVEAMHQRIPAKLVVAREADGSSHLRAE